MGTGGASVSSEAPADAVSFCAALHAVYVDRDVACAGGQRDAVTEYHTQSWQCDAITHTIADGTVRYDRDQASACLTWLKALPCGRGLNPPHSAGPCDRALAGQVADAGPCVPLDEHLMLSNCARPSTCDTSTTCPGICRPAHKLGEDCTTAPSCERGTFCGQAQAGGPLTCQPVAQAGQACLTGYEGKILVRPGRVNVCVDGYHCDETSAVCVADEVDDPCLRGESRCSQGVCKQEVFAVDAGTATFAVRYFCGPLPKAGEPCVRDQGNPSTSLCSASTWCTGNAADGIVTGTCKTVATLGQSCVDTLCVSGERCNASQRCEASTKLAAGYSCQYDLPCGHPGEACCLCVGATCPALFNCGANAACDAVTMTCVAR